MRYIVVAMVAVSLMGVAAMAKEKKDGAAAPKVEKVKAEKPAAAPSFKGKLSVVKDGDTVKSATLTVKDVAYQIKLDEVGLKLANEAADKDVTVHGAVTTTPGADGAEVKTITVEKYKVVPAKEEKK